MNPASSDPRPGARSQAEIEAYLTTLMAETLDLPETKIDPDKEFKRYGLDSASVACIVGDLEDWFDRELDTKIVYEHPTITRLAQALAQPE